MTQNLVVSGSDAYVTGSLENRATKFGLTSDSRDFKLSAVVAEEFHVKDGGTIEGFITNEENSEVTQGLSALDWVSDSGTNGAKIITLSPARIGLDGNGSVRSGINRAEADQDLGIQAPEYVDRGGPYNPWESFGPTPDYNCFYEVYIERASEAYFRETVEGSLEWSYDSDYSATHPLDSATIDLRDFSNSVFVQNGWDPAWGAPELHFDQSTTCTVLPATDRAVNCVLDNRATVTVQYENGQTYPGGTAYLSKASKLNIQGDGISESWNIQPYVEMGDYRGYVYFRSGTVKRADAGSDILVRIMGGNINYYPKDSSTNTYGPDNVHLYKTAYDISDCPDKVIKIVLTDSTIIDASECYYYPIDNMLYVWAEEYVKVDYVVGEQDRMFIKEDLGDGVYKMGWPDQYRELKANGNTKFYRDPDGSVTMTAGVIQTLEHWDGMLDPILLSETSTLADNQRAVWSYLNDNEETVVVGENSLTCTINDLSDIVGSRTYTCTVYETADNGSEAKIGTYSGNVYVMRWKEGKTVVYSAPGEEATFTAEPSEECTWAMSPSPQWQVNKGDGNGWVNIDGATDASYTFTSTAENFNWKFRRNVNKMLIGNFDKGESNIYLDFSSREFSVTFAPEITGQPQSLDLYENTTKTYEMSVTAKNAESYQWQKKLDGVFTDLEGETASTLKLTATIDDTGTYRCIVRNAYGVTISAEASANWTTATTFSKITGYQVKLGETAQLSVDFENFHYDSVKWQYSTDDGASWIDVIGDLATDEENISMGHLFEFVPDEGGGLTGVVTGAMLQILKTTADMNGWKARCVVYGSFGEYYSETVTLEIELPDCTVTFDANGGSGSMDDAIVTYGSYTLPECGFTAPKGKQFKGWAASADGEVISDSAITVTEDITLYAVWETIPTQEVSTGEELAAVIESNALSIKLMTDITVSKTIAWSDKEITLDLNGHVLKNSSSATVIQIKDGSSADITALILIDSDPTATHAGLPYKGGVIDDSIVVTATGSGNNDCRLYANGGSVTGHVNLSSYASSIRCTSDTPTAFYGNASQYGGIYGGIFYGNTSLKTIKNPTLTFRYDDGNIYAREVLESGKKVIALENPTKTGYTFAGWDTEIPETMPEDNLTITAQWTANKYAITYEGMDGVDEGQEYPDTHTYDTDTVIPNPTKTGHTFNGWKVNGGETPVKDLTLGATDYTDDITLTAVWENILYTVSFDANGGTGEMEAVTGVSGSYTLPECGFTAPEG
ncbi:MAG: InlB B-repeat-containing protein, partial [Faecousia sp.]